MPKGRWRVKGSKHKVRAHISNKGTRDCLASDTTSRLPGSNSLLAGGPIIREGSWGTPRSLTDSSSHRTHHGDNEHQLDCEGWGHWENLYGHCNHFHGVSGPQWPKSGDTSHGAYYQRWYQSQMKDWTMTALGRGVGWWLPLGRRIEMPLGRNHNLYFCFSYFCLSYMPQQLLAFAS